MDVSSFFVSIIACWAVICLILALGARLLANATPSVPATPSSDQMQTSPVYTPAGESLSAARLAVVLVGVSAPLGVLWLSVDETSSSVHLLAGGALAVAFLISLCHGLRRHVLDADTRGER